MKIDLNNTITKFEAAFIQCLKDGVYPGPSNINERRGRGRFNRLNGQDTTVRRYLMYCFGVPFMRGNQVKLYNGVTLYDSKGTIPYENEDDEFKPRDISGEILKPGYRKHEILNLNEPWKLRLK